VALASFGGWVGACATALPDRVDGSSNGPDASIARPDAWPGSPDASIPHPDAAPGTPDAAPGSPDAALPPDARPPPDAAIPPDANCVPTTINLLSNGNFDSGPGGGWVEVATYPIVRSTADLPDYILPLPSGSYAAWMGGYDAADDRLYHDVAIPGGATNLQLSFRRWIETLDSTTAVYDQLFVEIWDTSDNYLESVISPLDNTDSVDAWVQETGSPSGSYQGQTIRVFFGSLTDDWPDSWTSFYLDSVTLNATVVVCL